MKIFSERGLSSAENQKTIRTMINIDRQSLLARAARLARFDNVAAASRPTMLSKL